MGKNDYQDAWQLNQAGGECLQRGDLEGALENFSRALELLPEDQIESKAKLHNNRGHIYVRLKRYEDAVSAFIKALGTYESLSDSISIGEQLGNIGSVYRDMEKWDAALENYSKSLAIFEAVNHKRGIADQYSNLGYVHFRQGGIESAFQCFQRAKALYDEIGDGRKSQLCEQNLQALSSCLPQ